MTCNFPPTETNPHFVSTEKPLLRALGGHPVWPPPLWLMRQAGRYLPEFRACREKLPFLTRCLTPDIATELTLQPIRRFGMDGAILFSDILILPHAMGQELDFVENLGPVLTPIRDDAALDALQPEAVASFIAPILETLRHLRRALPPATSLLGFAGSSFTVSCYMVEGRSSRDYSITREAMLKAPAFYDRLMALLTDATAEMLVAQIDAGAEAVMLFDSWAGLLPPRFFRRYVIAPTRQIVTAIRAKHPHVKIIGFPRFAGVMAPIYAQETGIDALACDTGASLDIVAESLPDSMALQGNLDPLILKSGGDALTQEAQNICRSMSHRPHIFNLGHGVMPETPPEHVAMLVEAVRMQKRPEIL
ncbi:MAG: uroporphyrinogen decarboxylase [Acetobacteraceae bacterium]